MQASFCCCGHGALLLTCLFIDLLACARFSGLPKVCGLRKMICTRAYPQDPQDPVGGFTCLFGVYLRRESDA